MKRVLILKITSLLAILLASFHLVDDIVYGSEKGAVVDLVMVAVLAVWLYGTLVLSEGRAGHIIMLLGSLVGLTVFFVHLSGTGGLQGIEIGRMSGVFFFVWTLFALAVLSLVSLVLSAQNLLSLPRSNSRS